MAAPLGLLLLVGLVAWRGFDVVVSSLKAIGFEVLWLVPLFGLLLAGVSLSWKLLLGDPSPAYYRLYAFKWIGFATNWLLPVAQVGGEVARTRLLERAGVDRIRAIASVLADKTVQGGGIGLHALFGLACLATYAGGERFVWLGGLGALTLAAAIFAFYRVQRRGFRRLGRWVAPLLPAARRDDLATGMVELEDRISETYRRRRTVITALLLEVLFRVGLTVEIMLVAQWLGHPITFAEGLILEGVTQVVRAGSFVIPGALGVQEGAYVMLGAIVGLPGETALAASLVRRARMLMVGLPGLALWNRIESRRTHP